MMSVLAAYAATVAVFLILPGPLSLVVMNGANRYGFKGALLSVAPPMPPHWFGLPARG